MREQSHPVRPSEEKSKPGTNTPLQSLALKLQTSQEAVNGWRGRAEGEGWRRSIRNRETLGCNAK